MSMPYTLQILAQNYQTFPQLCLNVRSSCLALTIHYSKGVIDNLVFQWIVHSVNIWIIILCFVNILDRHQACLLCRTGPTEQDLWNYYYVLGENTGNVSVRLLLFYRQNKLASNGTGRLWGTQTTFYNQKQRNVLWEAVLRQDYTCPHFRDPRGLFSNKLGPKVRNIKVYKLLISKHTGYKHNYVYPYW